VYIINLLDCTQGCVYNIILSSDVTRTLSVILPCCGCV